MKCGCFCIHLWSVQCRSLTFTVLQNDTGSNFQGLLHRLNFLSHPNTCRQFPSLQFALSISGFSSSDFPEKQLPLILSCLLNPTSYDVSTQNLLPEKLTMAKLVCTLLSFIIRCWCIQRFWCSFISLGLKTMLWQQHCCFKQLTTMQLSDFIALYGVFLWQILKLVET